jgi:carbonic anhydrase
VVSCIDRRLNSFLEKNYNDGETLFVRTAGANVNSLKDTELLLKQANKIIVVTHSDCGAIGVVYKTLNERSIPDELERLISPFLQYAGHTRSELEHINAEVQGLFARKMSSADIQTEFVLTKKLDTKASENSSAVITRPSTVKYSEMLPLNKINSTFIVQNLGHDRAFDKLILTKFLGINNLTYI